MDENPASNGYEMVPSWKINEGQWYSYARDQGTAMKLRVAVTFFGEPYRFGEINHAVDVLAFYAEAQRVAVERIAKRIWKQILELSGGTMDRIGASISHCRISATDDTLLLSVLCVRPFFEHCPNLRTSDVCYVDINGAADHCWKRLVSNAGPPSNSDSSQLIVSRLQSIQSCIPSIPLLNNKSHACVEWKPMEVPWSIAECVQRLGTDSEDGPSQSVSVFLGHRVPRSAKRMALVLFVQLNVLLEMQDVEFILSTKNNKERLIKAAGEGDEELLACLVEVLKRQGISPRLEGGSYLVVTLQDHQSTAAKVNSNDRVLQTSDHDARRPAGTAGTCSSFCCAN